MNIANCPKEAWDYEFIVVYNMSDDFSYYSHTANGFEAEQMAKEIASGLIIHNVRIQGHKEPPKEKLYTFYGSWSWGCYAKSKDEAIIKFNNEAYPEELDISHYEEITEEDA